jgi:hypothetical protein
MKGGFGPRTPGRLIFKFKQTARVKPSEHQGLSFKV